MSGWVKLIALTLLVLWIECNSAEATLATQINTLLASLQPPQNVAKSPLPYDARLKESG